MPQTALNALFALQHALIAPLLKLMHLLTPFEHIPFLRAAHEVPEGHLVLAEAPEHLFAVAQLAVGAVRKGELFLKVGGF